MKIPNVEAAYVPEGKITGYLLDASHPVGGAKARFFRAHGFTEAGAPELAAALLTIARSADAEVEESPHGAKYVAVGDLRTPGGVPVRVRTVWIVEPDDPRPRLVTAYPA